MLYVISVIRILLVNGLNGGKYNLDQLVKKFIWFGIQRFLKKKFVILTGGEPLLQVNENLVKPLKV